MSIPAAVQHIAAYHPDGSSQFEKAFKMSTPVPIDLTDIVLLLADFTGVDDILKLSNNSAYSFTPPSNAEDPGAAWLGQLSAVPKGPILCLKFGQGMFSAEGWVFGSAPDTDAADIQLSVDNKEFTAHCPRSDSFRHDGQRNYRNQSSFDLQCAW
ncbi:hypothetical protein MAJ_11082, partial [Metarhizium majus ARSEF 297]